MDAFDLASFRQGRLVGTVDEVRAQVAGWEALGVDTIILGVGAVPFQVGTADDVELLLHACTTARSRTKSVSRDGVAGEIATATKDAAPLAFGGTTPHAVLDPVLQRVLEALRLHAAVRADALRRFDTHAVGREELGRLRTSATRLEHPRVFLRSLVHGHLLSRVAIAVCPEFSPWLRLCRPSRFDVRRARFIFCTNL